jgi:protein-S-isoprenylcysteine O-methyltransferase Ste14
MHHPAPTALVLLGLAWLVYFAAHSALASLAVKRWIARRRPALLPGYRLAFNGLAVLLLLPVLALMHALRGPWLWSWEGPWALISSGLAVLAIGGYLWSMRWYDGGEFLGLRQWREHDRGVLDRESLHLSPLHRYVRHPWYALGLVIVWTLDMDAARLVSAVAVTLYLFIGSRLEERKLALYHGGAYEAYRRRVPGLIPWPGRTLTAAEAEDLLRRAEAERHPPPGLPSG